LLGASLSPCCRSHPARETHRVSQLPMSLIAFTLVVAGSASGARHFRGHLCVRLRCGPVTRHHPVMMLSMGFRSLISLLPAIQLQGCWLLPWQDSHLLNTPAFPGRTTTHDRFRVTSLASNHSEWSGYCGIPHRAYRIALRTPTTCRASPCARLSRAPWWRVTATTTTTTP
jgi:hypothetical protein